MIDYGFSENDKIYHIKDSSWTGRVISIDRDYDHGGITTCLIHWDDYDDNQTDIQWTNKLRKMEGN